MANNKNTKYAVSFTCIGFLFCLTALVAPYWLQNDGVLQNPKFHNIGEWLQKFEGVVSPPSDTNASSSSRAMGGLLQQLYRAALLLRRAL